MASVPCSPLEVTIIPRSSPILMYPDPHNPNNNHSYPYDPTHALNAQMFQYQSQGYSESSQRDSIQPYLSTSALSSDGIPSYPSSQSHFLPPTLEGNYTEYPPTERHSPGSDNSSESCE